MFGTTKVRIQKSGRINQITSTIQGRVRAIKARWDSEERELRKKIAEQRIQHLIGLLGLNEKVGAA